MARGIVLAVLMIVGGTLGAWGQESAQFFRSLEVGWNICDLAELNRLLSAQGYPTVANELFIWGGENTVLPTGVLGGWSVTVSNWYGSTAVQRDGKLTRFTLTWFGGVAERPLFKSASMPLTPTAGLIGGVGISNLTVLDHRPEDLQEALRSPAAAFFTRWFFTVGPQLSVSLPLITLGESRALVLKLSVGYGVTFDNGMWDQEGRALKGPPANFNSWIVQLSVGLE